MKKEMKEKAVRIGILFIGLLAVVTIVTRVLNKASVIQVQVKETKQVQITHKLSTSAQVTAMGEQAVTISPGVLVCSVYVTPGQSVSKGEVLFQLDETLLVEEIHRQEQELQKLQLQKQSGLSQKQESDTRWNQTLKHASEDYNRAVRNGTEEVNKAWKKYEEAKQAYERITGNSEEELAEKEVKKQEMESQKEAYDAAVKAKEEAVIAAGRAVEEARITPAETTELEQLQLDIDRQEENVQKLKDLQADEGQVKASENTTVTKVNVVSGQATMDGAAVLLADETAGLKLTATFGKEEAQFINRNTKMLVTGRAAGTGEKISEELPVSGITESTDLPDQIQVMVKLKQGTFAAATTVEVEARSDSSIYEEGIPLSALGQDGKNEYFVYVAEETETFLGKEMQAKKVKVELLDKDETCAAISSGGLLQGKQIITEVSRTVTEGSRIRLPQS